MGVCAVGGGCGAGERFGCRNEVEGYGEGDSGGGSEAIRSKANSTCHKSHREHEVSRKFVKTGSIDLSFVSNQFSEADKKPLFQEAYSSSPVKVEGSSILHFPRSAFRPDAQNQHYQAIPDHEQVRHAGSRQAPQCPASNMDVGIPRVSEHSANRCVDDQKVHIQTAFSMLSLYKVANSLNSEKRELVESIGMGALLQLPKLNLFPRQIVLWLMSIMDIRRGGFKLQNGRILPFRERDVHLVLGVSCKGKDVADDESGQVNVTQRLSSLLVLNCGEEPTLRAIESFLLKEYNRTMTPKEREGFKFAFMVYVDAYFLCPKGQNAKINWKLAMKVSDSKSIPKINWCRYVLSGLEDSAKKVQASLEHGARSITIEGCLFFLLVSMKTNSVLKYLNAYIIFPKNECSVTVSQVFYIDNLAFTDIYTGNKLTPRCKYFTWDIVKKIVAEDKIDSAGRPIVSFGRTKVNNLLRLNSN